MTEKLEIPKRWQGEYEKWSRSFAYEAALICRLIRDVARLEQDLSAAKVEIVPWRAQLEPLTIPDGLTSELDRRNFAAAAAFQLLRKFPQIEPLVITPLLRREAAIAFLAFIEVIADKSEWYEHQIKLVNDANGRLTTQVDAHVQLLTRFRDKLKIILPKVDGFVVLQAVRSGNPNIYDGPNIEQEMKEADELLAARLAAAQGGK